MPVAVAPEKIPVVLLYNVDPQWTKAEKEEAINLSTQLGHALIEVGYPTVFVPIADDDIAHHLHPFDPSEHIIFNWCESLPGLSHSEWLVAKRLEMLGFTFTGADSETLALAQDKYRVKILLGQGILVFNVGAINAVQHHVHGSYAQHGAVHVIAEEHVVVIVGFQPGIEEQVAMMLAQILPCFDQKACRACRRVHDGIFRSRL